MNIIRLIKKNRLFTDFDDKEINAIFDCLKGRIVKYSLGTVIAQEGSQIEEIGILLDGTLLKFITKPDGEREALGTIEEGGMFGEVDGYLADKTLSFSVLAADDITVLYINLNSIVTQCSKTCSYHQKLMNNMLSCLAERIKTINKDTEYLIIKSMRLKIAKLIYDKYLLQGNLKVELGINRNEMAEYLNVSRPSMSREMMRMRDEGIIEFWKDKITIKDLDRLKEIVGY